MRRFLILTTVLLVTLNSCLSFAHGVSGYRGVQKIVGSVVTGGFDGWAASAMLRSPVGWVNTAGAVYGGLTVVVLLLNLITGVSDLVELRSDVPAGGTAMKPATESGLIESKQ